MHLLVTRPEPDADTLAAQLQAAGHTVTREPMLIVEPVQPLPPLELHDVQALIVTSRNAMRALSDAGALPRLAHLPLLAVGPGTTAAARAAGVPRVLAGAGSAVDIVGLARGSLDPAAGALLHLSGEEVAFDLMPALTAAGFTVRRQIVYRTRARQHLSAATEQVLQHRAIDGVVLMSPRTASVYAELIARHGLSDRLAGIVHCCLSAAVAERLEGLGPELGPERGPTPGDVVKAICRQPNLEEMLALIGRLASQSCESLDSKS